MQELRNIHANQSIDSHLKSLLGGLILDLVDNILGAVDIGRQIFDRGVGDEAARVHDYVMSGHGGHGRRMAL